MEVIKHLLIPITAITLGLFVAAGAAAGAESAAKKPDVTASGVANAPIELQRSEAQHEGEKTIDKDAVAAIEEAQKAVKAISDGKVDPALAAIERATGKINILTARKPSAALIPVSVEVAIIDLAPKNLNAARDLSAAAQKALSNDDYPKARALIDQLASEIHVKTYNLPLATYPVAMQTAARLLDEKKTEEAKQALLTALNTLIVTDQVIPLPLAEAQGAVKDAQAKRETDKPAARKLLASAKDDLERAKALGYANKAPEYATLSQSISD
ncbi:MAG: YfdX family protein [Pseudomonadota bacterium]|nr:YfdX family protein [Pseudomonadota bacterium]